MSVVPRSLEKIQETTREERTQRSLSIARHQVNSLRSGAMLLPGVHLQYLKYEPETDNGDSPVSLTRRVQVTGKFKQQTT